MDDTAWYIEKNACSKWLCSPDAKFEQVLITKNNRTIVSLVVVRQLGLLAPDKLHPQIATNRGKVVRVLLVAATGSCRVMPLTGPSNGTAQHHALQ